jgi:hypothetical protein
VGVYCSWIDARSVMTACVARILSELDLWRTLDLGLSVAVLPLWTRRTKA